MTIGERIKLLREENDMTQSDVAEYLGIATQTVFKYEKNIVTNIPLDNVEKLSVLFNVTPSYITGWSNFQNQTVPHVLAEYNKLNSDGKELADEYISYLLGNPKYNNTTTTELAIAAKKTPSAPSFVKKPKIT